jgi:hypothetical protein
LGEMSDGVAHATWTLAQSRSGLFEDQGRRSRQGGALKTQTFAGPHALR